MNTKKAASRSLGQFASCLSCTIVFAALGSAAKAQDRMPPLPTDKLTEAQKKVNEIYKEQRKSDISGPPWAVLLRVPELVVPALEMRRATIEDSVLGPKLSELAVFLAAREWTNNYEWNSHYNAGIRAGLNPAIISAIADGRRPEHMAEDEEIVYDVCTEILHNKGVSDATYARAVAKFGESGVVEAAAIEGFYTYLSMVMNTARSPAGANAKQVLAPFPH